MTTVLVDSDFPTNEILNINEDCAFEYGLPFVTDDLYANDKQQHHVINNVEDSTSCRSECSSEEDYFDIVNAPHAPPPSPQDTCMLDIFFANKLTSSLEACLEQEEEQIEDKALRRRTATTNKTKRRSIHKKSHSLSQALLTTTATTLPWCHRKNLQKVSEQAEKLKLALHKHLLDEETSHMIKDLNDMDLK